LEPESVKPHKKQKMAEETIPSVSEHPVLYAQLRTWRNKKAEETGVPVYLIFSQKALFQMSTLLPVTTDSLFAINGFGHKKVEQFGAEILAIIQKYCTENNLNPVALSPKNKKEKKEKPPKPDSKKESFELYKSGKNIEQIAEIRQFAISTIESHLAHFIAIGELDIHTFLSTEKLKKLEAFKPANETNFVGEAKAHFGDEFSYGELRMAGAWLKGKMK
jgi:ribonuclease D